MDDNTEFGVNEAKKRYGSLPYVTDTDIIRGPNYASHNRVVNKSNEKGDVQYEANNFLQRICKADQKRQERASQVVKPMTAAEVEERERERYYRRNPQARPLDESDLRAIHNYIDDSV